MQIGELANTAKCSPETIRFYEKVGLLTKPERTQGNYRHYGKSHIERLRFIRNCRNLDMTHEEIKALLLFMDKPAIDCGGVNLLLDEHMAHVEVRIKELKQLKQQLSKLRDHCQIKQTIDTCGILHKLTSMDTELKSERHTHL